MLNTNITYNAFLKRKSLVLNSCSDFQKDRALFFQKIKILNQIFFLDTGFQASKLCPNLQISKFRCFESPLDFDRIFKNDFILHFREELGYFFQIIYSFTYATSSSTKILEIKNEKISVRSKFLSFFLF